MTNVSKIYSRNDYFSLRSQTTKEDRETALLEKLKEHGKNSNIHGISHILCRKNNFRRLLWIMPFLSLAGFAAYQLYNVLVLYQSYPKQTNVKLDFKPMKLPAITICNMNPIRRTKVVGLSSQLIQQILLGGNVDDAIKQRLDNFTDIWNSDVYTYDYGESDTFYDDQYSDDTDRVKQPETISPENIKKELLYAELTHLSWNERYFAGHQYRDFVISCEFRGVPCDNPVDEYLSLHYGNCYTLYSRKYIVGVPTATSGITLKINLENYESLALSEGYGAILMIHEYGQEHPEDRALIISGGTETHVKLQMVRK
ncbi:unnamed protein product [Mytilus edulis]|uniref:Uncharacterized protein n=1 Tax=Mytilus edulis TaxID=6550 RepID=A0A8S3Q8J8_MYTED|nr:unnamed protein product [Mytilus edulis]